MLDRTWDEIIPEIASKITSSGKKTGVLLSPQLSNEELYSAKLLFQDSLKLENVALVSPFEEGFQDDILIRSDKNPNTHGAEALGFKTVTAEALLEKVVRGELESLVIFGQDLTALPGAEKFQKALEKAAWTVFIGTNHSLAAESSTYLLPAATHFEKDGTFTNFEGLTQKFNKVLEPLGEARPQLEILAALAKALGLSVAHQGAEDLFRELAGKVSFFKGLDYETLESAGGQDIRSMAAPTIPALEQYDNIL